MINVGADETYEERMRQIKGHLKDIEGLLEDHDIKSGSNKHWMYVTELNQVAYKLIGIERFLGG